jgi:coatomer protein complex subunit gamma
VSHQQPLKTNIKMIKEMENLMDIFTGGPDDVDKEKYSKVQHPYDKLKKEEVLQAARIFHDSHSVREEPSQCCRILAQLLRLNDVESHPFSEIEATEVFFGVTKLFMSDDASLRRMVYLFIKEVAETCNQDDVIIVTSCLTKDMTCDVDLYRANALRVLVRIVDAAMLGAIERYVKQAIVDSSPQVACSALVSAVHLYESSPDSAAIVRRWISETQQAIRSRNHMVQFQGIQLLYLIKSQDRLGVSKLVSQFSQKKSVKSPLARVLLIRYAAKLIRDEVTEGRVIVGDGSIRTATTQCQEGFTILEDNLKDPSDMVAYEAARAICTLPMTNAEDLNVAVNRLRTFLKSKKPATVYASLKTLSIVASRQPRLVSKCNPELEKLLKSKNKAVATLAVTTLLRTASEDSIDDLLRQISSVLDSLGDDYQINVVKGLLQLCLKYPSKHLLLVAFLSRFLADQGTFDFKRSIVLGIVALIKAHPEAADSSLLHLCEYIEDCEYDWLLIEILHVLGDIGPTTMSKQRYIRFIYNRTMLDQPQIRAAAVSALSKFATQCPSLRTSIVPLLCRSLEDSDDEVRDRANVAVTMLEQAMKENPYVPPPDDADADEIPPDIPADDDPAAHVFSPLPVSFEKLGRSLAMYKAIPGSMESQEPLTFSNLPVVEDLESPKGVNDIDITIDDMSVLQNGEPEAETLAKTDPAKAIYDIPELASFGRVFKSCPPVALTETETEYVVHCVKHILDDHVILQFKVQNTIEDQRLDNVTIEVSPGDEDAYEVIGVIPAEGIAYGDVKDCFTILRRTHSIVSCPFHCNMDFVVVSMDDGEETGDSYNEEYSLEEFALSTADFMAKIGVPDFRKAWEALTSEHETMEKFSLHYKTQQEAVHAVLELLGMKACDNTDKVSSGSKPQILHLSGVFLGGKSVLVRARLSMDKDTSGVILQIAVRSEDKQVSCLVLDSIT